MSSKAKDNPLFKIHATGAGVTAALLLVAGGLAMIPMSDSAQYSSSIADQLADLTDQVDSKKDQRVSFERELARLNARLGDATAIAEAGTTLTDRLLMLNKSALDAGLTVTGTDTGKAIHRDLYTVQPLELSGRGDYASATTYLAHLLDEFSDIRVIEVDLRKPQGSTEMPTFRFALAWYSGSDG